MLMQYFHFCLSLPYLVEIRAGRAKETSSANPHYSMNEAVVAFHG